MMKIQTATGVATAAEVMTVTTAVVTATAKAQEIVPVILTQGDNIVFTREEVVGHWKVAILEIRTHKVTEVLVTVAILGIRILEVVEAHVTVVAILGILTLEVVEALVIAAAILGIPTLKVARAHGMVATAEKVVILKVGLWVTATFAAVEIILIMVTVVTR
jgi:hypothetical protein